MAGAGGRRTFARPVSRYPAANSEPLPRRPVCSEYCLYRFMSVLYGISYFVSTLLSAQANTQTILESLCSLSTEEFKRQMLSLFLFLKFVDK